MDNRFSLALVKLHLAMNLADEARDEAALAAREKVSKFGAVANPGRFQNEIEQSKIAYTNGCASAAWESAVHNALSKMGVSVKSFCNMIGRDGREALTQHEEGLTTFREFINWISDRLWQRADQETS